MELLSNLRKKINNIPEFSEKNYTIVGYIIAVVLTLCGGFFIYEVLSTDALTFRANWNMFKSPLGNLCWFIGFIWAMLWWGKFVHWSSTPVIETRDRYTGKLIESKENYDVMEQGFAKFVMPLIGHFVIEPIMYAAIIYYPLQCIIALVGTVFPYVLSLIVLAIVVGAWMFTHQVQIRYRSVLLVLCGVLFAVAFCWGGYVIRASGSASTIQMMTDTSAANSNQPSGVSTVKNSENYATPSEDDDLSETEGSDDQFEGVGEEGLYGSLPEGTTEFIGDMDGFPISLSITKSDNITAVYENLKFGTTMNLNGESLPAMGGDISFFGKLGDEEWFFNLTGTVEHISGTANRNGENELKVKMRKNTSDNDDKY